MTEGLEKGAYKARIPIAAKNRLDAHIRERAADEYAERVAKKEAAEKDYRWIIGG